MNLSDMLINEAPYEEDGNFTDFYNLMADQNFLSESKHLTQLLNQLELEYLTKFVKNRPDIKFDGFSKIFPYEDFTSLLDKIDKLAGSRFTISFSKSRLVWTGNLV